MKLRKFVSLALVPLLLLSLCGCTQVTKRDAADEAISIYLAKHWPDTDFVPQYYINLFGHSSDLYYRIVSSASSDTWFTMCYQSDVGVITDNYEEEMERGQQGYHTVARLLNEYEDAVEQLLEANHLSDAHTIIQCDYDAFLALWESGEAELDMPFSPKLPISWSADIGFDMNSDKPANRPAAKVEVHRARRLLAEAGYTFSTCRFTVNWWNKGELTELEF